VSGVTEQSLAASPVERNSFLFIVSVLLKLLVIGLIEIIDYID